MQPIYHVCLDTETFGLEATSIPATVGAVIIRETRVPRVGWKGDLPSFELLGMAEFAIDDNPLQCMLECLDRAFGGPLLVPGASNAYGQTVSLQTIAYHMRAVADPIKMHGPLTHPVRSVQARSIHDRVEGMLFSLNSWLATTIGGDVDTHQLRLHVRNIKFDAPLLDNLLAQHNMARTDIVLARLLHRHVGRCAYATCEYAIGAYKKDPIDEALSAFSNCVDTGDDIEDVYNWFASCRLHEAMGDATRLAASVIAAYALRYAGTEFEDDVMEDARAVLEKLAARYNAGIAPVLNIESTADDE